MPDEIRTPAVDVPDAFIDSFLEDGAAPDKQKPGGKKTATDETDLADDETQEEGTSEDDEGDTEDEGEGEDEDESEDDDDNEGEDEESDEDDEESDEDDDDDSETDDDEDEDDSFLSKETLKKHRAEIDKNPHLKAVFKSMQRDYTLKTTEVAKHRRAYEQANAEYEEFAGALADKEEGGGREQFLIDAALDEPKLFQRAFDRAAELLEDPDSRKKYERERDVEARDAELRARERTDQVEKQRQRVAEIHESVETLCARFEIGDKRGVRVAKQYVANRMLQLRAARKDPTQITTEEIREAVREAARDIKEDRDETERRSGRKARKQRLDEIKDTARKSKKTPVRPSGRRSPSISTPKPPKLQPGQDGIDARFDQLLKPSR